MMWEEGRNLWFLAMGTSCVSFEYNDQGIRTSKTDTSGVTYHYVLDGTRIVAETWGNELLIYLYDDNGSPIGMQSRYSGYAEGEFDTYWFEKNLQGDIIAVYNENGVKIVEYTYDAWGNFTTTYCNGGENDYALDFNPFRYRGYYYDEETGFYYLNSRYYDPVTGRFINADGELSGVGGDLRGNNLYAYCYNNPVMYTDPMGNWPKFIEWLIKAKEWLDEHAKEDDGSYALYDNDRFQDKKAWHEQFVQATPSLYSENGEMGLGIDGNIWTGGWEWEHVDFSLFDFGHFEANAGIGNGGTSYGAMVSVWSPSISFKIGKYEIDLGAEIGAIGTVNGKKTSNSYSLGFAYGLGGSINIQWD